MGLLWAEVHPPSEFCGNHHSVLVLGLSARVQGTKQNVNHCFRKPGTRHIVGNTKLLCETCAHFSIFKGDYWVSRVSLQDLFSVSDVQL